MEGFKEALNDLRLGKVIAYPSEGVWGLGCDPRNKEAVLKLLNLKKRPMDKGLILVASNISQMEPYIDLLNSLSSSVDCTWHPKIPHFVNT